MSSDKVSDKKSTEPNHRSEVIKMDRHEENPETAGSSSKDASGHSKYREKRHGKDKERRMRDFSGDDSTSDDSEGSPVRKVLKCSETAIRKEELMRKNTKVSGSYGNKSRSRKYERSKSRSPDRDYKKPKRSREKKERDSSDSSSSESESSPVRKSKSESLKKSYHEKDIRRERDFRKGKDIHKTWRKDDSTKHKLPDKPTKRGRSKDRRLRDSSQSSSSSWSSGKASPVAQSRSGHQKQPIAEVKRQIRDVPKISDRNIKKEDRGRKRDRDSSSSSSSSRSSGKTPRDRKSRHKSQKIDVTKQYQTKKYEKITEGSKELSLEHRGKFPDKRRRFMERRSDSSDSSSSSSSEDDDKISHSRKSKNDNYKKDLARGESKKSDIRHVNKYEEKNRRSKYETVGKKHEQSSKDSKRGERDSSSSSSESNEKAYQNRKTKSGDHKEVETQRREVEESKKTVTRHVDKCEEKNIKLKYQTVNKKMHEQNAKDKRREMYAAYFGSESSETSDEKVKVSSKELLKKISTIKEKVSKLIANRRRRSLSAERIPSESSSASEYIEETSHEEESHDGKETSVKDKLEPDGIESEKIEPEVKITDTEQDVEKFHKSDKKETVSPVKSSICERPVDSKSLEDKLQTHNKLMPQKELPTGVKSEIKFKEKSSKIYDKPINEQVQLESQVDENPSGNPSRSDQSSPETSNHTGRLIASNDISTTKVGKADIPAELKLAAEDKSEMDREIVKQTGYSSGSSDDNRSASKSHEHKSKQPLDFKRASRIVKRDKGVKRSVSKGESTKPGKYLTSKEHQARGKHKKPATSGSCSSHSSSSRSKSNSSSSSSDTSSSDSSSSKGSTKTSVSGVRSSSSSSSSSSTASESPKRTVKTKDRARKRSRPPPVVKRRKRSGTPRPKKIHIGRLSRNINKSHLEEIFGMYGRIKNVDMPIDRTHGNASRGFAYVEYEKSDDAEKATEHMNGGMVDGQMISVAPVLLYKPKPAPVRRSSPMRRPFNRWRFTPPFRGGRGFGGDRRRRIRSPFRRRSPRRRPRSRSPIRRRHIRRGSISSSR